MSDLISRQAAIDAFEKELSAKYNKRELAISFVGVKRILVNLPSVQPRKGKWMPDNTNYYDERYICSECNANYKVDTCMGKPSWNFCPNCGSYNGGESNG